MRLDRKNKLEFHQSCPPLQCPIFAMKIGFHQEQNLEWQGWTQIQVGFLLEMLHQELDCRVDGIEIVY